MLVWKSQFRAVNLGNIVKAVGAKAAALRLPPDGFVRVEGQYEAQRESTITIGGLSLISFGLIFALLFSRYRSAVLALIVMAGVPMALVGSVIALPRRGNDLWWTAVGNPARRARHPCPVPPLRP